MDSTQVHNLSAFLLWFAVLALYFFVIIVDLVNHIKKVLLLICDSIGGESGRGEDSLYIDLVVVLLIFTPVIKSILICINILYSIDNFYCNALHFNSLY